MWPTKIVTHPDNVRVLQSKLAKERPVGGVSFLGSMIEIVANSNLEKEKPTGRYILPCGRVVERDSVSVKERFVEYGPEDIDYLLWIGRIRREMELLFYEMNDRFWRMDMLAGVKIAEPRAFVYAGTV